jgi:Na+-driven multidrug efflux pump
MISGAVLNIIGDPILIYGFGMGTFGAGLATAASQFVGFLVLLRMTRRPGNIPMRFRNFKPKQFYFKEITRGGLPSLFRQGFNSFAIIIFNHAGGLFGDQAVAAISIVQRVSAFAISALLGFGQGFQPVCGFNYGAKRYDRVIRAFVFCAKIITIALVVIAIFGFIFAPRVIAWFRADDAVVIAIGAVILRLQCCTLPFMGFVILCNMMLQTIGAAVKASLLAISRSGLFLAPAIVILVTLFKLPGLEWAQTVADICTMALATPLSVGTLIQMNKMMKQLAQDT